MTIRQLATLDQLAPDLVPQAEAGEEKLALERLNDRVQIAATQAHREGMAEWIEEALDLLHGAKWTK